MKREFVPRSKGLLVFYRFIIVLICFMVMALIAGSVFGFLRSPDSGPLFQIGGSAGGGFQGNAISGNDPYPANNSANDTTAVFSGIGRLRIPAAGQTPATVILSISFPYPPGDRAFAEELASRISEFRSIAAGYFGSLSKEEIARLDEEAAKAEILKQYNALLRLGRIETLYFSDLMIVE